jgi:hypothetical protein
MKHCIKTPTTALAFVLFKIGAVMFMLLGFFVGIKAQPRLVVDEITINLSGGIQTNPIFITLSNPASTAISTSNGGMVLSEGQYNILKWNIADQIGDYVVPFCNQSSQYIPINLKVTGSGSSNGYINFSTYATSADNLPLPIGVSTIAHVDTLLPEDGALLLDRFWIIDADSYSSKPTGSLELNYSTDDFSEDLIFGTTNFGVQMYDPEIDAWEVAQLGSDNLNGVISGIQLTDESFFPFYAVVKSGSPLPITLINFHALWGNDEQSFANVNWTTASELNNAYFEVHRSHDGINWNKIDQVEGAGTSIHSINYQISDKRPIQGTLYYRLKQVDFDGAFTFSHIVALNKTIENPKIIVYPNPIKDEFHIKFNGFENYPSNLLVYDNLGKMIQLDIYVDHSESEFIVNATNLPSGVYFLYVITEFETLKHKFTIIK